MPTQTWRLYLKCLKERPILSKVCTSSVLFASSDLLAQTIQQRYHQKPELDLNRSVRAAAFGGPIYAPILHYWFQFMEHAVKIPSHLNLQAAARVCIHSGVYAPVMAVSFFIGFMTFTDPANLWRDNEILDVDRAKQAALVKYWLH
jgi:hypothetical protein